MAACTLPTLHPGANESAAARMRQLDQPFDDFAAGDEPEMPSIEGRRFLHVPGVEDDGSEW